VPWGIVGPAGMSAALTKTLHDAFHKSLSDAAFVKTLALVGQEPWDADSTAYRNYMVSRIPVERDLVAKYRLKER
jgi:tripartite-type tricarboxylate transporter receptor subunit TctC